MAVFDFIEGWYNPHRRHSAPAMSRASMRRWRESKRYTLHGTGATPPQVSYRLPTTGEWTSFLRLWRRTLVWHRTCGSRVPVPGEQV